MFNEPQLLLVFRVALEIQMVYGLEDTDDATEDVPQNQNIPGDAIIDLEGEMPLSPDSVLNYDPSYEGKPLRVKNKIYNVKLVENIYMRRH